MGPGILCPLLVVSECRNGASKFLPGGIRRNAFRQVISSMPSHGFPDIFLKGGKRNLSSNEPGPSMDLVNVGRARFTLRAQLHELQRGAKGGRV